MRCSAILIGGVLVALVACSSAESSQTQQPTSTVSQTAAPGTVPPTTVAPTTVSLPTEAASTTTLGESGWRSVDPATVDGTWGFPCCAGTWMGEPSPPLPKPGQPLPSNGSYAATVTWAADPTAPLQLELRRFEPCNVVPAKPCGGLVEPDDDTPGMLDVVDSPMLPLTVPLDEHVRVVLTGVAGDAEGNIMPAMAAGTGADLADLAVAVESAFASVLMPKLASGMTSTQVVQAVSAAPEGGFVAGLNGEGWALSFVHGTAPPLWFDDPFGLSVGGGSKDPAASRGTDVLLVPSVQMINGALTVYVYAGFYP